MPIRVQMPNGTVRPFREGTPKSVIRRAQQDMLADMKASGAYEGFDFSEFEDKGCGCAACTQSQAKAPVTVTGFFDDVKNTVRDIANAYNKPGHNYSLRTEVCTIGEPGCTLGNVRAKMPSAQYPDQGDDPIKAQGSYSVLPQVEGWPVVGHWGDIHVQGSGNNGNPMWTNHTKEGHIFHNGRIDRTATADSGKVYINTHGHGSNNDILTSAINQFVGSVLFRSVDNELIDKVMGPEYRKKKEEERSRAMWETINQTAPY